MFQAPEEIIDLSLPIDNVMPIWPTLPEVTLETLHWVARDGFRMERVEMQTHTATHVDSPRHFIPEGKTLDDFPVDKFMGEGVVLDLTPKEPAEPITADELEAYADQIEEDDVVMLHTGWDEYHGRSTEWLFEYPFLSGAGSQFLADAGAKAVGIDTPSVGGWTDDVPAHGPSTEIGAEESHLPLLRNDVIPIEELTNLDAVLDGRETVRAYFFYPPLNFQETSGSSVRAFAFL